MSIAAVKRISLAITVTVRSPFLFPGLDAGRFGLDAIALRDTEGRPLIPADQMRGVLRHALEDIVDAEKLDHTELTEMFGQSSADAREAQSEKTAEAFAPERGCLHFTDLVMHDKGDRTVGNRVRIDSQTGAAKSGELLFVELVAKQGFDATFTGQIAIYASEDRGKKWIDALRAATTRISAIGAMKTAGYGEVVSIEIHREMENQSLVVAECDVPQDVLSYKLTIDRPFLVDARRAADNVYVGSTIIPGGALKGLLARHLELLGRLDMEVSASLTALRISHARVEGGKGPMPLSLVAAGDKIGDALAVPYGKGAIIDGKPATFRSDWKPDQYDAAGRALGWGDPVELARSVRMHVAIERDTGIAEDQKLFIANAVDPGTRQWVVQIDFPSIENEDHRKLFAGILEAGMDGLGRTGARVDFNRKEVSAKDVCPVGGVPNQLAVVLETDAVMVSPSDGTDPRNAYTAFWARVIPGVELDSFYASQRLAGGYIARRYRSGAYAPFWLTEAGSIFLLSGEDIKNKIQGLLRSGLPAPMVGGETTTWQTCPFQPENGYGAISADYDPKKLCAEVQHV